MLHMLEVPLPEHVIMHQSKLSCAKVINLKSTGSQTPQSSDISPAPSAVSNLVTEQVSPHDPYQAFRFRDYRLLYTAEGAGDRKSTRLNSSHTVISYAVFCL